MMEQDASRVIIFLLQSASRLGVGVQCLLRAFGFQLFHEMPAEEGLVKQILVSCGKGVLPRAPVKLLELDLRPILTPQVRPVRVLMGRLHGIESCALENNAVIFPVPGRRE